MQATRSSTCHRFLYQICHTWPEKKHTAVILKRPFAHFPLSFQTSVMIHELKLQDAAEIKLHILWAKSA